MIFKSKNYSRPYHYGPFPFEDLATDAGLAQAEADCPAVDSPVLRPSPTTYGAANKRYYDLFTTMRTPSPLPLRAPVPDDLERRVIDLKGMAYFLDSAHVGTCSVPENAWCEGSDRAGHDYAIVIAVEHGRIPEPDNPAHDWLKDSAHETAVMRGMEIAACIAIYICQLGYKAHAHAAGEMVISAKHLQDAEIVVLDDFVNELASRPEVAGFSLTDRVASDTDPSPVDLSEHVAGQTRMQPLLHWSGKDRDIRDLRASLEQFRERDVENVLFLTGDKLKSPPAGRRPRYLESVAAIQIAREVLPDLFIAAAMNPFKYCEEESITTGCRSTGALTGTWARPR